MSRHADVPVQIDDGAVEYLPASAQVRTDRPPKQGFGRARKDRETYALGSYSRDERSGFRVTLDDGRTGTTETWEQETMRLRGEVAAQREQITALRHYLRRAVGAT